MKKLAIVSAAWRRPHLTRLFLDWTAQVVAKCNGFEVDLIVVTSPEDPDDDPTAIPTTWHATRHANSPLAMKWQHGVTTALERGADAVMLLGSDDFLTVEIVRSAAKVIFDEHADVFGLADFRFLADGPRAAWWPGYSEQSGRIGEPMGAARTLSRRLLLDILKGVLWTKPLAKGLDGAAWKRIKNAAEFFDVKIVTLPTHATQGMLVDVKLDGDPHVCQFQDYLDTGSEEVPPEPILGRFPDWLVQGWGLSRTDGRFACRPSAGVSAPLVSLVMIAKDSEKSILRAMRCAMPVVDEAIVVVDEKTEDKTFTIAKDAGAWTVIAPWQGFGPQREYAHSIAKGKFHLILDADETLEANDLDAAIQRAEQDDEIDAILVNVLAWSRPDANVPSYQPRVIRAGRAHWAYRRHNELIGLRKAIGCNAVIRNSYVGRLPSIAEASIADLTSMYEHPSDPFVTADEERAHACLHLARSYLMRKEAALAVEWARRARQYLKEDHLKFAWAVMVEAWATLFVEGQDAMEQFARRWLEKLPNFAELHYIVGSTHMTKWYCSALQPGRYALIPQQSLMHMDRFRGAAAMMGFPVQVIEEPAPSGMMSGTEPQG